ncbi:hypothetical protein [Actinacidiphila glaucinigra]|nr:hypothetical protein [Actinacidiphila glaucinigra]
MNPLTAPLSALDPDLPALRARTEAPAAAHPLHPHLPQDGDVAR